MKTTIQSSLLCLLAMTALSLPSCDKDHTGDTEKPVIHLIEPEEGARLPIGDEHGVPFNLELSDNTLLRSYKVEIHPDFDGHVHAPAHAPLRDADATTTDFTFNKSWDISGKKNASIQHREIIIPPNATPGPYHLMVYCTDAAGNESHLARDIILFFSFEYYSPKNPSTTPLDGISPPSP
jgi:hypothetical protein